LLKWFSRINLFIFERKPRHRVSGVGCQVSGVSNELADTGYKSRPSFDKIAMAIWFQVSGVRCQNETTFDRPQDSLRPYSCCWLPRFPLNQS